MTDELTWLNEPPRWQGDARRLVIWTGLRTDFWRHTFYGFVRDDGHFFHRVVAGDFTAEVTIAAGYEALYDQAGLMLRVDDRNWLKAGIELTDNLLHFSTVMTREDFSDWAACAVPDVARQALQVRLTRHDRAVRVQFRLLGEAIWRFARLGYLPMREGTAVGPMCCSPEREGLEVEFRDFRILPPIPRQLHEPAT